MKAHAYKYNELVHTYCVRRHSILTCGKLTQRLTHLQFDSIFLPLLPHCFPPNIHLYPSSVSPIE